MDTTGTRLYQLWRKKRSLRIRLTVVAIILCGLSFWLFPRFFPNTATSATTQATTQNPQSIGLTKGTPNYTTLVPSGKTINSLGGWTRVSPPDHNAVYAFADTLWGIPIIISEQPLPASFKNDTDTQIADLAKNYSANRIVMVDDVTVYVGTSTKGPQSLIFTKEGLLILIKSTAALNDEQWTNYIRSLK